LHGHARTHALHTFLPMHFYPHARAKSFSRPRELSATAKSQCLNDYNSVKKIVHTWNSTRYSRLGRLFQTSFHSTSNTIYDFSAPLSLTPGGLKWVFLVLNDRFYDTICISINFNLLSRNVRKLFRYPSTFSSPCIYIYVYTQ